MLRPALACSGPHACRADVCVCASFKECADLGSERTHVESLYGMNSRLFTQIRVNHWLLVLSLTTLISFGCASVEICVPLSLSLCVCVCVSQCVHACAHWATNRMHCSQLPNKAMWANKAKWAVTCMLIDQDSNPHLDVCRIVVLPVYLLCGKCLALRA